MPQELTGGGDGEGATEFHDYEGGGIGEGEGVKDVSDKIENEDQVTFRHVLQKKKIVREFEAEDTRQRIRLQVEDTFREGQEKSEEEPDKRNIKEEDDAIEMSEDFDGKMHDGETRESGVRAKHVRDASVLGRNSAS